MKFKAIPGLARDIVTETKSISLDLFRIMIPVLIVVKALELLGVTRYLAELIKPIMTLLGLPPELGIVWAGTLLSNIYTGLVLFVSEPVVSSLTVTQVTVLGILMLVAHSLPVELRVAQKIGVRLPLALAFRVLAAIAAAWLYYRMMVWWGYGNGPADILWQPDIMQQNLAEWGLSQLKLLLQIVLIIGALVIMLRVVRVLRLDRLIHLLLRPLLPMLGMTTGAVNVALVGMTLGLTYGGGILIRESREGSLGGREIFFSVLLLLLCHGLIEDTMLILLIGADIYGILLFRLVFSVLLIAVVVRLLGRLDDAYFDQRLLSRPQSRK